MGELALQFYLERTWYPHCYCLQYECGAFGGNVAAATAGALPLPVVQELQERFVAAAEVSGGTCWPVISIFAAILQETQRRILRRLSR